MSEEKTAMVKVSKVELVPELTMPGMQVGTMDFSDIALATLHRKVDTKTAELNKRRSDLVDETNKKIEDRTKVLKERYRDGAECPDIVTAFEAVGVKLDSAVISVSIDHGTSVNAVVVLKPKDKTECASCIPIKSVFDEELADIRAAKDAEWTEIENELLRLKRLRVPEMREAMKLRVNAEVMRSALEVTEEGMKLLNKTDGIVDDYVEGRKSCGA